MNLRRDIHTALDAVIPPVPPHLSAVVLRDLQGERRRPSHLKPFLATGVAIFGVVLLAAAALLAHRTPIAPPVPAPASAPVHLMVTRWVVDPTATSGPHAGYRPEPIGMNESMVSRAAARRADSGWVVDVTVDQRGTVALTQATAAAASACPADCPERHLAVWSNLTSADIASWSQTAGALSRPYAAGGKLLTDPLVNEPIRSGQLEITGFTSEHQAEMFAAAIVITEEATPAPTAASTPSAAAAFAGVDWSSLSYPVSCGGKATASPAVFMRPDAANALAVVLVSCGAGAGSPPSAVLVFDNFGPGGGPHLRQTLLNYQDNWLVSRTVVSALGTELMISPYGYSASNVPRCCPDLHPTLTWSWSGERYIPAAPEPAHYQLPPG